jgi:hypothetical protein
MRRWTAAGATLACVLACGTVTSSATGGPPSEESLEALRERLITAYRAAPTIHRGYVIEVNGALRGRVEMYREGRLHGLHMEDLKPGKRPPLVDFATDGDVLMARVGETSLPRVYPSLRPKDPRSKRFHAFLDAICRMYEFTPPDRSGMDFVFTVTLPSAAEAADPTDPESVGLNVGLTAVAPIVPTWLHASVLSERKVSGALEGDLVAARLDGWDALLHASDGTLARVEGVKVGTGRRWILREVPAETTVASWRARIADLCRGTDEGVDAVPPDEASGYHLAAAVLEVQQASSLLESVATRRPVVEMLCNAAWADRATSLHWWARIQASHAEAAGSAGAEEPRAVTAVRKQLALTELIKATQNRLIRATDLAPFDDGFGDEVDAQIRQWIADRMSLLWLEYERASNAAKER